MNVPTARPALTPEDLLEAAQNVLDRQLEIETDPAHPIVDGKLAVCPRCWMIPDGGSVPADAGILCRDAYSLRLVVCPERTFPRLPADALTLPVEWAPFRASLQMYETVNEVDHPTALPPAGCDCGFAEHPSWPGHGIACVSRRPAELIEVRELLGLPGTPCAMRCTLPDEHAGDCDLLRLPELRAVIDAIHKLEPDEVPAITMLDCPTCGYRTWHHDGRCSVCSTRAPA